MGECDLWSFNESRYSPIEATYIEFLTFKVKIVHKIIYNNQFDVEIEELLALGNRSKGK